MRELPICEEESLDVITISESLKDFDDRMNKNKDYDRDGWWGRFLEELSWGNGVGEDLAKELTRIYWEEYAEAAEPYPFTTPVLNYLKEKEYKLRLITDTDASGVRKLRGSNV